MKTIKVVTSVPLAEVELGTKLHHHSNSRIIKTIITEALLSVTNTLGI